MDLDVLAAGTVGRRGRPRHRADDRRGRRVLGGRPRRGHRGQAAAQRPHGRRWSSCSPGPGAGTATAPACGRRPTRRSALQAFPFFLLGFLALAIVRSARLVDPETIADVDVLTRACFVVALAGLGMQTRLGHLRAAGPRPFVLGFGTAALLAGGSLAAILAFDLGPARTQVAGALDPRLQGAWTTVCKPGADERVRGRVRPALAAAADAHGHAARMRRVDRSTGNTVQRTTRGVATLRRGTGDVTFTDGRRRWSIADLQLRSWSGPALVPPADAPATPLRAPGPAAPDATAVRPVQLTARVIAHRHPRRRCAQPGRRVPSRRPDPRQARRSRGRPAPGRCSTRRGSSSPARRTSARRCARADWAPGAVLSLATDARAALEVPPDLGASGGQASRSDGAVQLYTAQSRAFVNRVDPDAPTAGMPAVSNPLGISVNNAFGRPWVANAPGGGYRRRDGPRPRRTAARGPSERPRRRRVRRHAHQPRPATAPRQPVGGSRRQRAARARHPTRRAARCSRSPRRTARWPRSMSRTASTASPRPARSRPRAG